VDDEGAGSAVRPWRRLSSSIRRRDASIRRWETSIQPWRRLSSSIRRRDALVALGRGRRCRAQRRGPVRAVARLAVARRHAARRAPHRNRLLHRGLLVAARRRGLLCTAPAGDGAEEQ